MSQTASIESPANEVAEFQAGIAQCLAEIEHIRELMNYDQAEIDRSRKRTHALLADLKATVSRSGQKAA